MDDQQKIQDGEIVEEDVKIETVDGSSVILNLESLIKNNVASIEKLTDELRALRNMFTDSFANDPVYKGLEEKAKEANKAKNSTKQQLLKQPSVMQAADKIRTITAEIKEKKDSMSDYLLEYSRMAGVNEIEGHDGEIREIIHQAKLLKKSSKEPRKR